MINEIYDINEKLEFLLNEGFDPETGEIKEGFDLYKAIDETKLELDKKLGGINRGVINRRSKIDIIKTEIEKLKHKITVLENENNRLTEYLDKYYRFIQPEYFEDTTGKVHFHKFDDGATTVSYRKSTQVDVINLEEIPEEYIKIKETKSVDKAKIKEYLKNHKDETINGVKLVENKNIVIK